MARRLAPLLCLFCFVLAFVDETGASTGHSLTLRRQKREWIIPPKVLEENVDYTKEPYIARIRSDKEDINQGIVSYALKGIGVDQEPYNLFMVDPVTGNVRVTQILDREQIAQYNLSGTATFRNRTVAESDIQLRIKVKDQNDNAPIFSIISPGAVDELSSIDTPVMKVVATDADEPGNPNSQLRYELIDQKPPGKMMFRITPGGEVLVSDPYLDRETIDQYILTVKASDLNGAPGCNTGTATFKVLINDVNDNAPTLEQNSYDGSIEENTNNVEVMRFKAKDLDLPDTNNSMPKFNIDSGNAGKHFKVFTDPKTNEGVLMLVKPVDYEEVQDMNLGIVVYNVAPYHPSVTGSGQAVGVGFGGGVWGTGIGGGGDGGISTSSGGSENAGSMAKVYNMNIKVKNQPEGPRFDPKVKAIPISEDRSTIDITKVFTKYAAIDGDTGLPAQNVIYAKNSDPDNWLTIDDKTGEIKLNKIPDRESPYLVNGTYMAEIICISQDMPSKTATGTVAIQVEDFNDHCPTLTSHMQTICTVHEAVYVTARDEDIFPNGAPFKFSIVPEKTKGKWSLEHFNDTTAVLKIDEPLWPGSHEVTVEVRDQQGLACPEPQVLKLGVCTCDVQGVCGNRAAGQKGSALGGAGIGLLLLGLLLLLLIPLLLLLCQCGAAGMGGAFAEMPFDTKEHLMSYHTEGQGEDRDIPLHFSEVDNGGMGLAGSSKGRYGDVGAGTIGAGMMNSGYITAINAGGNSWGGGNMEMINMDRRVNGSLGMMRDEFADFDDEMALPNDFLYRYFSEKSHQLDLTANDNLVLRDYEGKGSPAGSVGCCSDLEFNNDLEFLNSLGPKFTTLAEICGGTKTAVETFSPPAPKPLVDHSESISVQTNITKMIPKVPEPSSLRTEESMVVTNRASVVADMNPPQTLINMQPAQTLMVQHQPMYYVVEPQVSNTVLLAERPAMGLTQGMYVLNGAPMAETVLVQGAVAAQGTVSGGERVMLLETNGGSTQALNTGLLQSSHMSGSQLLLVDGGTKSEQILQGTLQKGGIVGSQGLMMIDGQGGSAMHGSLQSTIPVPRGSQNMMHVIERSSLGTTQGFLQKGMAYSAGSQSGTLGLNTSSVTGFPTSTKVVMQEKKSMSTANRRL